MPGFAQIRAQIQQDDRGKNDLICAPQDVLLQGGLQIGERRYTPTHTAFKQLQALHQHPPDVKYLRVRTRGDQVWAAMPWEDVVLDNLQVVDLLHDAMGARPALITDFRLDPDAMHLRVVFPDLVRPLDRRRPPQEDLGLLGIHLSHTETGSHQLALGAIVWRQVCSNGAYGTKEEVVETVARGTVLAPERLSIQFREAVQRLVSQADAVAERLAASSEQDMDLHDLGQVLSLGLPLDLVPRLMRGLGPRRTFTRFELINAVTAAAQEIEPFEKRVEAEKWACRLLDEVPTRPRRHAVRCAEREPVTV